MTPEQHQTPQDEEIRQALDRIDRSINLLTGILHEYRAMQDDSCPPEEEPSSSNEQWLNLMIQNSHPSARGVLIELNDLRSQLAALTRAGNDLADHMMEMIGETEGPRIIFERARSLRDSWRLIAGLEERDKTPLSHEKPTMSGPNDLGPLPMVKDYDLREQNARHEIHGAVLEIRRKYDLTVNQYLSILAGLLSLTLGYETTKERQKSE